MPKDYGDVNKITKFRNNQLKKKKKSTVESVKRKKPTSVKKAVNYNKRPKGY